MFHKQGLLLDNEICYFFFYELRFPDIGDKEGKFRISIKNRDMRTPHIGI